MAVYDGMIICRISSVLGGTGPQQTPGFGMDNLRDRTEYFRAIPSFRGTFVIAMISMHLFVESLPQPYALCFQGGFNELNDPILAYSFKYPTETVAGKKLSVSPCQASVFLLSK